MLCLLYILCSYVLTAHTLLLLIQYAVIVLVKHYMFIILHFYFKVCDSHGSNLAKLIVFTVYPFNNSSK